MPEDPWRFINARKLNLRSLVIRGTGTTDFALSYLKHAKNMQSLMLDRTKVTDATVVHLRGLSSIRSLDLTETAVTEEGIASIREWLPQASLKPLLPDE
jgi:internalin A